MTKKTRDNLLEKAELLFSEKGFHGTSIQDISVEVSVTKQGLLHHFPTKEKLYAEVLNRAALYISDFVNEEISKSQDTTQQLINIFESLLNAEGRTYQVIVLLLRELIDNRERADTSNRWFLKPFLDRLTEVVKSAKQHEQFSSEQSLALVYHLLGATQYFLISQPTLRKLYSQDEVEKLKIRQIELIRHHFKSSEIV